MPSVKEALVCALADLDALGLRYAVIGGLAVSARVEPRMTRDVDLAVSVGDDAEAEQALFRMQQLGYVVQSVVEQAAVGRLATARLVRVESAVLDLLFCSSGIEQEIVAGAERIQLLRGTTTAVASIGHLLALKVLSEAPDRPQDLTDLVALGNVASSHDWHAAFAAAHLVTSRGCDRGRDLGKRLVELRQQVTESR